MKTAEDFRYENGNPEHNSSTLAGVCMYTAQEVERLMVEYHKHASQSKWISMEEIEQLKRRIEIYVETSQDCIENFNLDNTTKELLNQDNVLFKIIVDTLANILVTTSPTTK